MMFSDVCYSDICVYCLMCSFNRQLEALQGDVDFKQIIIQSRDVEIESKNKEIEELHRTVRSLELKMGTGGGAKGSTARESELIRVSVSGMKALKDALLRSMRDMAQDSLAKIRNLEVKLEYSNRALRKAVDALEERRLLTNVNGNDRRTSYGQDTGASPARLKRAEARVEQISAQLSQAMQEKDDMQLSVSVKSTFRNLHRNLNNNTYVCRSS